MSTPDPNNQFPPLDNFEAEPNIDHKSDSKPETGPDTNSLPPSDNTEFRFETCRCPITTLPLHSTPPNPEFPTLPGPCIYHHRASTRKRETAIFDELAPSISELKEVIDSGMVRYRPGGVGGQMVRLEKGQTRQATEEEIRDTKDGLKQLIAERDELVRKAWEAFVGRWGGGLRREDDGRMFVVTVDEEEKQLEREGKEDQQPADNEGGDGNGDGAEANEADPYVLRMRGVQARMDELYVVEERKKEKRARAGRAAEEYTS